MVDPEVAVRQFLASRPTVTALVGTRIYASINPPAGYDPQASGPCIVFGQRGGRDAYHNRIVESSIQYRCIAADAGDAWQLYSALHDALVDKAGGKVVQTRQETPGQYIVNEVGWPQVFCGFRHWLQNEET